MRKSIWEPVNQAEGAVVRQLPVLPARPPHPLLITLTMATRGSGLWLLLAAILFTRAGVCRRAAIRGVLTLGVASSITHLLAKRVMRRRRPQAEDIPARQALPLNPTSPAFPSAHATSASAFTTALALESPVLGIAVAPLAAAITYARVRTRVHWPTDVLGGLILGTTTAYVLRRRS